MYSREKPQEILISKIRAVKFLNRKVKTVLFRRHNKGNSTAMMMSWNGLLWAGSSAMQSPMVNVKLLMTVPLCLTRRIGGVNHQLSGLSVN